MISLGLPAGPLSVLCLAAHPDDLEIGCGGTLLRLAERGDVTATFVTLTGTPEREAEAATAAQAFLPGARSVFHHLPDGRLPAVWGEVKQALEDHARELHPDLVLCPSRTDAHQDHRLVARLVPTVWRDALVLEYEIPKSDGDHVVATAYVPLPDDVVERKLELLAKHYPSQHGRAWWDPEVFRGVLRLRGMECQSRYAEAFAAPRTVLTLV